MAPPKPGPLGVRRARRIAAGAVLSLVILVVGVVGVLSLRASASIDGVAVHAPLGWSASTASRGDGQDDISVRAPSGTTLDIATPTFDLGESLGGSACPSKVPLTFRGAPSSPGPGCTLEWSLEHGGVAWQVVVYDADADISGVQEALNSITG